MQPGTSYQRSQGTAILILGEPFTGKTNLAMQFPDPYFFDADDKLASAIERFPNKRFWFDCPLRDEKGTPIDELLRWEKGSAKIIEATKSTEVQTLVLDSATAIGELIKKHIMRFPTPGTKGQLMVGGEKVMEMTQWQPYADIWRRTIMACRASGKITIVIMHLGTDKDEISGAIRIKPLIQGQLKDGVAGLFTDVWMTDISTGPDPKNPGKSMTKFITRCQPTPQIPFLGNSLGLPAQVDTDQVWNLIKDKLTKPTDQPVLPS